MRDRETNSLWQQATGEAIYGELKRTQLEVLFGEQMIWKQWKKEHPDTLIALEPECAKKSLVPQKILIKTLKWWKFSSVLPRLTKLEGKLDSREEVFGIVLNGETMAFPVSVLEKEPTIKTEIGGFMIELAYNPKARSIKAYSREKDRKEKKPIFVEGHSFLAWNEFHPKTNLSMEKRQVRSNSLRNPY